VQLPTEIAIYGPRYMQYIQETVWRLLSDSEQRVAISFLHYIRWGNGSLTHGRDALRGQLSRNERPLCQSAACLAHGPLATRGGGGRSETSPLVRITACGHARDSENRPPLCQSRRESCMPSQGNFLGRPSSGDKRSSLANGPLALTHARGNTSLA
jgi:hypothetical protein